VTQPDKVHDRQPPNRRSPGTAYGGRRAPTSGWLRLVQDPAHLSHLSGLWLVVLELLNANAGGVGDTAQPLKAQSELAIKIHPLFLSSGDCMICARNVLIVMSVDYFKKKKNKTSQGGRDINPKG